MDLDQSSSSSNSSDVEYLTTNRNGVILLRDGHEYYKKRTYKNGSTNWNCVNRKQRCNATLTLLENHVLKETPHQCQPDISRVAIKSAKLACKKRAANTNVSLNIIFEEELLAIKDSGVDLLNSLPKFKNLKHGFYNARSKGIGTTRLTFKKENRIRKMTKGNNNHKHSEGKVLNFDHLIFWVANAKTASSYFVTRFGFKPLAVREATESRPVQSYAVRLNQITIVFESPTSAGGEISENLSAHGDFVKDVAFEVQDLDELVRRAKEGGAEIVKDITEEKDSFGVIRYAVLKTYGDNTHTLIDRSKYKGILMPGYETIGDDPLNKSLPATNLMFIDHVEGNMADGTLEDSVAWYEKNLNMNRFWCVDYKHDLVPYSCINSASVTNKDETVLLSMNEAAKGLRPTSKASEFVKALGTSGVEHIALYTDDIVSTMRNLKARGADILTWPPTYYDLIKEKLKHSSVQVAESIEALQEQNILIDFDERGYMLQAFTKHLQARPTVFIEILQRRNHRGFGAMNYKWVFEAIERLDNSNTESEDVKNNDAA